MPSLHFLVSLLAITHATCGEQQPLYDEMDADDQQGSFGFRHVFPFPVRLEHSKACLNAPLLCIIFLLYFEPIKTRAQCS